MQDIDEILKRFDLDFTISKLPLTATNELGEQIITPYFGLVNTKTNKILNSVKAGYSVSQNRDVVEMVLKGIKPYGDKLSISKAGSIDEGRKVFIQLKLEGEVKLGDDVITQYITIIDSNDGSTGLSIGIGDEISHCLNQFFRFYKEGNTKFRHTATIDAKIASIPNLIQKALDENLKQIDVYKRFMNIPINNTDHLLVMEVLGYDRHFTPTKEINELSQRSLKLMDGLYSAIETETQILGRNYWGLFNGLTRFTTHMTKINSTKENGKIESMILGRDYTKAMDGYELLTTKLGLK